MVSFSRSVNVSLKSQRRSSSCENQGMCHKLTWPRLVKVFVIVALCQVGL